MVQNHLGQWVWKTSLAAEYPQGLCEELASGYKRALLTQPTRSEALRTTFALAGCVDTVEPDTKKAKRKEENLRCVGGLRDPR
eukprot:11684184-Heterocapsa_arctica.AAC.1